MGQEFNGPRRPMRDSRPTLLKYRWEFLGAAGVLALVTATFSLVVSQRLASEVIVTNQLNATDFILQYLTYDCDNLVADTDELFQSLRRRALLTGKLRAYEQYWLADLRGRLVLEPSVNATRFADFQDNLFLASAGTRCSVTFESKQGSSSVKYVKSIDAGRVALSDIRQPTRTMQELEKAIYDFEAWRRGMMTEKKNVDCMADAITVRFD